MKKSIIMLISFIFLSSISYSQKSVMSVPADDLAAAFVRSEGAQR